MLLNDDNDPSFTKKLDRQSRSHIVSTQASEFPNPFRSPLSRVELHLHFHLFGTTPNESRPSCEGVTIRPFRCSDLVGLIECSHRRPQTTNGLQKVLHEIASGGERDRSSGSDARPLNPSTIHHFSNGKAVPLNTTLRIRIRSLGNQR